MRRLFTVLAAAVLLLTACAPGEGDASASAPTSSAGVEQSAQGTCIFTDSLGNTVELEQPPKRVAALLGSYAETWLLAGGEVAAVTQDAYDERGLELPEDTVNLGANQQPDLEALLAAEPDLVLLTPDLDGQMGLKDSLAAAGIPAAWFKVETFDDYLNMLKICTDLTGRSDLYQKNGLDIQSGIDAAIASVPEGEDPTVLLLRAYSSGVRAKNSDNIAGAMLKDLGAVNIADSNSGPAGGPPDGIHPGRRPRVHLCHHHGGQSGGRPQEPGRAAPQRPGLADPHRSEGGPGGGAAKGPVPL